VIHDSGIRFDAHFHRAIEQQRFLHRHNKRLLVKRVRAYMEAAMQEQDEEEFKRLVREAITDWLDKQFAAFGRWTAMGMMAMALAAILTFILWAKGLPGGQ